MNKIMKNLKFIKLRDIFAIFKFMFAIIPSFILKIIKKNIWLICEDKNEARDNGYVFFKYMCERNERNIDVVYAINTRSPDYQKVKKIGKCIEYGRFVHWIYYLAAKYNISSQKGGKPNAPVCYLLEVYGILKNKRIFLQHGITISDAKWLYYENTKMRLFVCGAKKEYEYVKKKFGYPDDNVKCLGFCRFDNLYNIKVDKKKILVMPSWREWLNRKTEAYYEFKYDGKFENSEYYKKWNSFLNNKKLKEFLEFNGLELVFYPHRNVQSNLRLFSSDSDNIKIASWKEYDIQELLMSSAIMITDYSSVAIDFLYMKKPVIYYTFDIEKFRKGQYAKGYFDYEENEMTYSSRIESEVIKKISEAYDNDFEISEKMKNQIYDFFGIFDNKNCERTYEAIRDI